MSDATLLLPLQPAHLAEVTRIHTLAFPTSALTALGKEAVRRYYAWQLCGPHQVTALGAWQGARLAGFCFGGVFNGAMGGFLRKNRAFLAGVLLTHPWFLLSNEIIRERAVFAIKTLRKKPNLRGKVSQPHTPSFGILSIAVDPGVEGRGYGKALMLAEEQAAIQQRFEQMHLTVHVSNQHAIEFYEHLGWVKSPPVGAWAGQMVKKLTLPDKE